MSRQAATVLGGCPDCGAELTTNHVLIKYDADSGQPMVWAECPNCAEGIPPV